jgi:predicted nucleotidyltransferase
MCSANTLQTVLEELYNRLKQIYGNDLHRVILYGSYARGDYDDDSDIDIMVLADIPIEDASRLDMELTRFTSRLGLEHDVVISLYVKDCVTFYKYLRIEPFYLNVLNDGVILLIRRLNLES